MSVTRNTGPCFATVRDSKIFLICKQQTPVSYLDTTPVKAFECVLEPFVSVETVNPSFS